MTRLPGLDPEDLATLRAHAREDGATRSRRARNPFSDAARVEHVEQWPCRRCGRMVGVTQEAVTALAIANAELVTRGDRPVAKQHVVWCSPGCKRKDDELEQARRRPHEQREIGFDDKRPTTAGKGRP